LLERIELSNKSKETTHGSMEKKLEKLMEERDRLSDELDQVKQDRDNKIQEYQKLIDKER
jgi:hypothetical protein